MLKKLLTIIAMLFATASFAAVDVNTANEAELDGVKGIGPGLSGKILIERKNGEFKDWNDFISRVSGVGNKSAANFSKEGLTVGGKKYSAAAAAKAEARSKKLGTTSARTSTPASTPHDSAHGAAKDAATTPSTPAPPAPSPAGSASASKN